MKNRILVMNQFRVGNLIGTDLKYNEDLLLSKDPKVIDFLNKYSKYLKSYEEEDFLEFFKLTGLYIGHHCYEVNGDKMIYFSMYGPYDYNIYNTKAFSNHILIETGVKNIEIFKNSIMIDRDVYTFKEKKIIDVNSYKRIMPIMCVSDSKYKIKLLKENNYLFPDNKEIKEILLDPFNNVLSLTDNGDIYINNYLYSKGAVTIFKINKYDIRFIYKNNIVEEYVHCDPYLTTKKYDKILFDNDIFLATLKDNTLHVNTYSKRIEMFSIDEELAKYNYNMRINLLFDMVTDIKYDKKHNELIIFKDKEQIHFSSLLKTTMVIDNFL